MQLKNDQDFALIALGSNLSTQGLGGLDLLRHAEKRITEKIGEIAARSNYYQTPAFPAGAGPDFVNSALALPTDLNPETLLAILHDIEAEFARERHQRWAARTLDLDFLFLGDLIAPDLPGWQAWAQLDSNTAQQNTPDELILPHPRLHERSFVLGPLRDFAAQWRHPVLGKPIETLWRELPAHERGSVTKIE